MPSITYRRTLIWAVAGLLTIASIGGAFFSPAADVEAYQPIGMMIYESEMSEPPCPYGHDDACESAAPPQISVNPYRSDNPHDLIPDASAAQDRLESLASFAQLQRRVNARIAPDVTGVRFASGGADASGGDVRLAITSDITGLPWVRDGVTDAERITGGWLGLLQDYNPSLVTSLTRMPFLQDHTPGDLQAIQTLTLISMDDPQDAIDIVNLSGFADGSGIDNTEAKIIAVMYSVYRRGSQLWIEWLADYGTVEEQTRTGQHGNTLTFAIVRVGSAKQNSELIQSAITGTQDAETLMGEALPTDFVGIVVEAAGAYATNNGISIQLEAEFDGTHSDRRRQRTTAHEIGHFWWSSRFDHERWISEGASSYIGAYSVRSQFNDTDLTLTRWPCPYYRTIEHLRADQPQFGVEVSYGSFCNYALGERLLINLDRNMTAENFTTAFRNFHQRLSTFEEDEIDQGFSLLRAFCSECEANPRNLGSAGYTLARYYGEKILSDNGLPNGSVPGLGPVQGNVSIIDSSVENRQYGVAQVSASSPDQRRWVRLPFSDVVNPPETANIYVAMYYEEREPYAVWRQERQVYSNDDGQAWFHVYLGAPDRRAPGHHWVHIYNESWEKIAEAEYQVMP